jgi:predicted MFS family arabinose efflux permease
MAFGCGVAVANIYYNQPMLGIISRDFVASTIAVGLIPTATQLGYAIGLALLVPLGDLIERRRLIVFQFLSLTFTLLLAALARNAWQLVGASLLVGISASVAQQIVPFAASMADDDKRGATIGTVMSGLLCGILFGRALAGIVSDSFGWRMMFVVGLILSLAVAALMRLELPRSHPQTEITYGKLLRSLITLWCEETALRRASLTQASLFASFTTLWTMLAIQLEQPSFHLGATVAGLFGIIGAVGILVAPVAGKIADRRGPAVVIALGAVLTVASWVVFGFWITVPGLILGVIILDMGVQASLVSNQHLIYALRPDGRNRLNTVFMSVMFVGGAIGSAGATQAWRYGGWRAVCVLGGVLACLALILDAMGRRSHLPHKISPLS